MTATPARPPAPTLTARLRSSIDVVYREMVKFGAVGAVAFLVDVGTFNLLRYGVLGVEGPFEGKPLTAKTCSVVVATVVAWLGNRYWTFRHRRRASRRREFVLFFVMNAAGLGIALSCLAISHYVLGLRTALADNVAANVVGLGLGTLFRFWAYKTFVFTHESLGVAVDDLDGLDEDQRRLLLDLRSSELTGELTAALPHTPAGQGELAAELLAEDIALAEELLARDGDRAGSAKRREA